MILRLKNNNNNNSMIKTKINLLEKFLVANMVVSMAPYMGGKKIKSIEINIKI